MSDLDFPNTNNGTPSPVKLYVKYKVSLRCKVIVKSELDALHLNYKISEHEALVFADGLRDDQHAQLHNNLKKHGMVLLSRSESLLVDNIITTILEVIHYPDSLPKLTFKDLINKHTVSGEESVLKIFSDVKGMSVVQFLVIQKIERAKELLLYEDMLLSDIAKMLNYKNENYLSAQIKKITGLTPLDFKRLKKERLEVAAQTVNT